MEYSITRKEIFEALRGTGRSELVEIATTKDMPENIKKGRELAGKGYNEGFYHVGIRVFTKGTEIKVIAYPWMHIIE
mgnify:FL=1